MPVAKDERDKSDTEINKPVSRQCKFMKDVEEINNEVASFGGTKH